jgi:hypothetical protein
MKPKATVSTSTATWKTAGRTAIIAKWCAILNREQFDNFIERCGLTAEDVQTMGSIGAPGFG